MKKTYIKPLMDIHQLRIQRILTASDPVLNMKTGKANKDGEVLSRQSDWDDEEEDDYNY